MMYRWTINGLMILKLEVKERSEMKMYSLFFDKKRLEICIEPYKNAMIETNELYKFNDCRYLCSDRKLLREKAKEIKESWLEEAKQAVRDIESLKIKNKY